MTEDREKVINDILNIVNAIRRNPEIPLQEIATKLRQISEDDDNNPDNTALDEIEQEIDNGVLMPTNKE